MCWKRSRQDKNVGKERPPRAERLCDDMSGYAPEVSLHCQCRKPQSTTAAQANSSSLSVTVHDLRGVTHTLACPCETSATARRSLQS